MAAEGLYCETDVKVTFCWMEAKDEFVTKLPKTSYGLFGWTNRAIRYHKLIGL